MHAYTLYLPLRNQAGMVNDSVSGEGYAWVFICQFCCMCV
jgi:hypothetical protein